jgi:hypothetical protein
MLPLSATFGWMDVVKAYIIKGSSARGRRQEAGYIGNQNFHTYDIVETEVCLAIYFYRGTCSSTSFEEIEKIIVANKGKELKKGTFRINSLNAPPFGYVTLDSDYFVF